MTSRLKIMACGSVERNHTILEDAQLEVLDTITNKDYNLFCSLIGTQEDGDYYEIKVCRTYNRDDVIDTCILDSSGNIFMEDDFNYTEIDDELGCEIIELFIDHFIVAF